MIDPTELTEGQEFRVRNERGVFVFRGIDSDGSIRCFGGAQGRASWRNFRADAVTKVLKKQTSRAN